MASKAGKAVYPHQWSAGTAVVAFNGCPNDPHKPTAMPIYQTATFIQPSAFEGGEYDYTRSGNPTRTALETLVAGLEGADAAFAFTTGMAALSCMTRLLNAGDEILCNADIYGGMYRLLTKITARQGVKIGFVESWDLDKVRKAITPRTKILHIESPSNPLMHVTDIRALSKILKERGVLLTVDNTILTPYLMKPLDLGADIVVHSATKFFAGHADTMCGLVCTKSPEHSKIIAFHQNAEGTALSPFDCFLVLRGLKTLTVRMDRALATTTKVVDLLKRHPLVKRVHFAGLPGSPADPAQATAHRVHRSQARGDGVLFSFETGDAAVSRRFVDALRLLKITVSFGGCGSVVEMPCAFSHASIPKEEQTIPADLVRISIGIEDADDIIADINAALAAAAAAAPAAAAAAARPRL